MRHRTRRILGDFETRSKVDLVKKGVHLYARDPSTRMLSLSWIDLDNRHLKGTIRGWPHLDPNTVPDWVYDPDVEFWASNAAFEQQIWNEVCAARLGWARLDPNNFHCLMKRAAFCGLPLALEKMVAAMRLQVEKDMEGRKLMLKWCKPLPVSKKDPPGLVKWADDPAEYERLVIYGDWDRDIEVMVYDQIADVPTPLEKDIMALDREINDEGFFLDTEALEGATRIAQEAKRRLNARMNSLTNGRITTCDQRNRILDFATDHGVDLPSLRAADVRDILLDETTGRTSTAEPRVP